VGCWRRRRGNRSIEAQVVRIGWEEAGEDGLVIRIGGRRWKQKYKTDGEDLGKGKGDSPKMARGGGAVVGEREEGGAAA
jgi:hypothetical protein